jgi:hypothetical protein
VSWDVAFRHLYRKTKVDNFIRLEDMQSMTMGLLVVASNPTTVVDVSTLSDEDKEDRIKEWLKQTLLSTNGDFGEHAIDFFGALVTQTDVLPDDILLCAGVKPADLAVVRANTISSKGLWNTNDAKTLKARQQFAKCIRQVWASENNVQMRYITKDQKKKLIIRHEDFEGGVEIKGHFNKYPSDNKKLEGYFLKGLHFAPQWTPDSKHFKCIEWATLLGDAPSFRDDHVVRDLLESYPTFNVKCVTGLLDKITFARQNNHAYGLRPPELVSLGEVKTMHHFTQTHLSPHVKCTFKHPSGLEVPDIWMEVSCMKKHYGQQCAHL